MEYRGGEGNAERSIDRPYVRQLLLSSSDDLPLPVVKRRGDFVNAIKIAAGKGSGGKNGLAKASRETGRNAKSRDRSTVIAIDESPAKRCTVLRKSEKERGGESAKVEIFTVRNSAR